MANKIVPKSAVKNETYEVNFDLLERGKEFWVRKSETVALYSKDKHKQAEKRIVNKYKGRGDKIKIVSVIYQ